MPVFEMESQMSPSKLIKDYEDSQNEPSIGNKSHNAILRMNTEKKTSTFNITQNASDFKLSLNCCDDADQPSSFLEVKQNPFAKSCSELNNSYKVLSD